MTGRPAVRGRIAAVATCLLLAACSGSGRPSAGATDGASGRAADCAGSVSSLLHVTQRYLNGLESTQAARTGASPAPSPSATADSRQVAAQDEFSSALQNIRSYAASRGCDPQAFQTDLAAGLQKLRAGGPVARAVLLQLRAQTATPPPSGPLRPGADVAAAVAAAPSGGTVQLGAGTFTVSDTVALLRGVTLRGAGRDATVLRSAAAGGPLLVLTAETVTLQDLTISRTGTLPGPVVSAGPVTTLVVLRARVAGARADRDGLGGVGILMSGGAGGQTGAVRRTSLRVTDTELVDNAVAGLVVAGEHRAELLRTLVARSGQCGVCFLGTSDGVVRDSRFVDDGAAVVTAGDSRPKVLTSTITGGQVGIQAIDRSAPEITHVTVTRTARAAMIWTATARGRLEGNRCVDVPFGIVVGPRALPFVGANACLVGRGRQ